MAHKRSYAGCAIDLYNRERLQLVFSRALQVPLGGALELKTVWPHVEPTVVPPRRLEALQRTKRCVPPCGPGLQTLARHSEEGCTHAHRYHLAMEAYRLAVDSWKAATQAYRRTRRRVRAFRHELYRARRAVRQEWR